MEFPNLAAIFKTGSATPGGETTSGPGARQTPAATTASAMEKPNLSAGKGTVDNPDLSRVLDGNENNVNADGTPKEPSSPLDAFKDVFTIDTTRKPKENPLASPLLTLDPAKLATSVAKMDFTRGINPELVQKALGGDAPSFAAAINSASQAAFAAVINMVVPLMEQSFTKNNQRYDSSLSDKIRDTQLSYSTPDNAALKHPAAQPVLAAIKKQVASQFPDMIPSEVTKKAEGYFLAMAQAVTGAAPVEEDLSKPKPRAEQNWDEFLMM